MFYALREGLAMVAEEGLREPLGAAPPESPGVRRGHRGDGARRCTSPNPADRLWTLNTPRVPEGVDDAKVRQYLLEKRGMEIAGGFGPLAGKVFRIGLMGYGSTAENVLLILEALEEALRHEGYTATGSSRSAAEKVPGGGDHPLPDRPHIQTFDSSLAAPRDSSGKFRCIPYWASHS